MSIMARGERWWRAELDAYVRAMVESIVDDVHRAGIESRWETDDGGAAVLYVTVPNAAARYVIGKRGATAESLRHLARCWAASHKIGLAVDVRFRGTGRSR